MKLIPLTSDYEMKPFDCGDVVSLQYRNQGWGSQMLGIIKEFLSNDTGYSHFRFFFFFSYLSAVSFYEKNDFKALLPAREQDSTQAMYFDMMQM